MKELTDLLQQATPQERMGLSEILACSKTDPDGLAECLQRASCSWLGYNVRKKRLSYWDVIKRVAERRGISVGVQTCCLS